MFGPAGRIFETKHGGWLEESGIASKGSEKTLLVLE